MKDTHLGSALSISSSELVDYARKVRLNAYAPYSGFAVGAAVLTRSGKIFVGCNVENSSYGATICAERVAVCSAIAAGEREVVEIALIAETDRPLKPCGICRQVLIELAPELRVTMANQTGAILTIPIGELLPSAFTLDKR